MRVGLSARSFGPRIFCAGGPAAPPKHEMGFFPPKLMFFAPTSIWGRAQGFGRADTAREEQTSHTCRGGSAWELLRHKTMGWMQHWVN